MAAADTFTRERALEREIRPTVESGVPGVEVLAVELLSPARFCVFIDHPAGVDHALCERPVRRAEHFRRAVGAPVQLRTSTEIAGKKRFRGAVVGADDTGVTVDTHDGPLTIPYDAIVRGNLIDEGVGGA